MIKLQKFESVDEYLAHCYNAPKNLPNLPLADEDFISNWKERNGSEVLNFFNQNLHLPVDKFEWNNISDLKIEFAQTSGGKLPVITTADHVDFRQMVAILNGKDEVSDLPVTVNAFTINAKAEQIYSNRVILLNYAPYSNVSAEKLNLSKEDWLKKSHLLRLRHESAHYETLRIFGGMRNHALDEILADCLGQIAAFGDFNADRQRLFFGLHGNKCDGRLQFYCRNVILEERSKIYQAVDSILDYIAREVKKLQNSSSSDFAIIKFIACQNIPSHLSEKF